MVDVPKHQQQHGAIATSEAISSPEAQSDRTLTHPQPEELPTPHNDHRAAATEQPPPLILENSKKKVTEDLHIEMQPYLQDLHLQPITIHHHLNYPASAAAASASAAVDRLDV